MENTNFWSSFEKRAFTKRASAERLNEIISKALKKRKGNLILGNSWIGLGSFKDKASYADRTVNQLKNIQKLMTKRKPSGSIWETRSLRKNIKDNIEHFKNKKNDFNSYQKQELSDLANPQKKIKGPRLSQKLILDEKE